MPEGRADLEVQGTLQARMHRCYKAAGSCRWSLNPSPIFRLNLWHCPSPQSPNPATSSQSQRKPAVASLNSCSQNGGNSYRAPYYNGNPNIGPRIIGNVDQYPSVLEPAACFTSADSRSCPSRGPFHSSRLKGRASLSQSFSNA